MRNFWLRLNAALAFSRMHPHIEHAPDWTVADSKALSQFLTNHPTGVKYRKILFWHVQQGSFSAVIDQRNADRANGYACGMRALAAVSDSLLFREEEEEEEPRSLTRMEEAFEEAARFEP